MPRRTRFAAPIALLLLAGGSARAELIPWSYNWAPGGTTVASDAPGAGKLLLTNEPMGHAVGPSDVVATNIRAVSTAPSASPDRFTGRAYSLRLTVTDAASGQSGTLTFAGVFGGTLTAQSA